MLVFVMIMVLIIMILVAGFHWKTAVRVKPMPG